MVASLAEAKSHNVTPDTFLKHYRAMRDAKRAKEDAGIAYARVQKAAKADGIDLEAYKLFERLTKIDSDEAEIQLRHAMEMMQWAGKPLGTQLDMFRVDAQEPTSKTQREHAIWEAGDAGLVAGRDGQDREDNPHEPGSEEHVAWDKSWAKGNKTFLAQQETIADELGENAGVKRGRGRPRKDRSADSGVEHQAYN